MRELPSSWVWSTIGELAEYVQRGKSPKYTDRSDLPVINQKCIRWNQLELKNLKFIHPDHFSAWEDVRFIKAGDVLWNSTGTGTVGRAYLVNEIDCTPPKVVDSHVTIVRPVLGIESRYLFNWIRSSAVQDKIEEMCDGTTNQIELSRGSIVETAIPVAPAAEQTRITKQLDILLARSQTCNDRLSTIPSLLKRFRQAVLRAATEGGLIDDTFELTNGNWTKTVIGEIAEDLRYGTSKKCDYESKGKGVLRIPNIAQHGRIDISDLKRADFEDVEIKKLSLKEGDLLVIRSNGSVELVGKIGLVTASEVGLLFAGYLIRLRVDQTKARPEFIQLWLSAPAQRQLIERTAKSTSGVNNLNAEELRSLPLSLPSLEEQDAIINRVKALFDKANYIEAQLTNVRVHAQRLVPLMLAKAFRGELVPQDPNDEPAEVLLARIAAERANAEPKTRKPRVSRAPRVPKETAAMTKSRQDDDVKDQPYLAGHLRRLGAPVTAETLFKMAELPVADFYKQLAWEVAQGYVNDSTILLEQGHAT